jgi:threonine dehydrogenase-like Zn-dependent dehydrogenase
MKNPSPVNSAGEAGERERHTDVVIVGAGLAGLMAARTLRASVLNPIKSCPSIVLQSRPACRE